MYCTTVSPGIVRVHCPTSQRRRPYYDLAAAVRARRVPFKGTNRQGREPKTVQRSPRTFLNFRFIEYSLRRPRRFKIGLRGGNGRRNTIGPRVIVANYGGTVGRPLGYRVVTERGKTVTDREEKRARRSPRSKHALNGNVLVVLKYLAWRKIRSGAFRRFNGVTTNSIITVVPIAIE